MQPLDRSHGGQSDPVGVVTRVHSRNRNGPVPDRLLAKFVYSAQLQSDFATNGSVTTFAANGMFSPNSVAGGTSTVKYFNEYSRLYQQYRVHSSKITCRWACTSAQINSTFYCFLIPTVSIAALDAPSTLEAAMAYPNRVFCKIGLAGKYLFGTTELFMRVGSLQGVNNIQDNADYAGLMQTGPAFTSGGSNPVIPEFYRLFVFGAGASSTVTGNVQVSITYYAEVFDTFDPEGYTTHEITPDDHSGPPADEPPSFDDMTDSVLVDKVVAAIKSSKK